MNYLSSRSLLFRRHPVAIRYAIFGLFSVFPLVLSAFTKPATKVLSGDAPQWVTHQEWGRISENIDGPFNYILASRQENSILEEDYYHTVIQINNSEGVQEMSSISIGFDPSYQNLIVHSIHVHRNGNKQKRPIGDFNLLQRETDLNRALYDGSLTAINELKDIRSGDIIEYSYTIRGYNPIYGNHKSSSFYQEFSVGVKHLYQSYISRSEVNIQFLNDAYKPKIEHTNNQVIYTWDLKNTPELYIESQTPAWYYPAKRVDLTTFKTWNEVAKWADAIYNLSAQEKRALKSSLNGVLKFSNTEEDIVNAIRFVQDEIRYLGFEDGIHSIKPHSPIQVYQQRFGDCKDKSFLLAAILEIIGVEAQSLLVHSNEGFKLTEQLPSPHAFNHCIVKFRKDGMDYIIDPTINGQGGSLDNLSSPNYYYGLPISSSTENLHRFNIKTKPLIIVEEKIKLDSINGSAELEVITKYKGIRADYIRSYFLSNSRSDIEESYTKFYSNDYPAAKLVSLELIDTSRNTSNTLLTKEFYSIPDAWEETDEQYEFYTYSSILDSYIAQIPKSIDSTPFYLGEELEIMVNTTVELPDTWSLESDNQNISNNNFDYSYKVFTDGTKLDIMRRYFLKDPHINVSDLKERRDDLDKISSNSIYYLTYNRAFLSNNDSNFSWKAGLSLLLGIIISLVLSWWALLRYDPAPEKEKTSAPIGGWMILPLLGLFGTIIITINSFSELYNDSLYSSITWDALLSESNYLTIFYLLLVNIQIPLYTIFISILIVLFFKRRSSVPTLMIAFYIFNLLFVTFDCWIASHLDPTSTFLDTEIFRALVISFIWIPYFFLSEQVKSTFTNRLSNQSY